MILDGGMGTLLQAAGLPAGKDPCDWNIEKPDAIAVVHRAYLEAGSDMVLTNTFGANRLKYHGEHDLGEVICRALEIARSAGTGHRIALDIGPTGKLMKPAGDLEFEDAVAAFKETISFALAAASRPDAIFIETMSDLHELKAAVLAAKESLAENSLEGNVPIYCTVALQEDGKLLTGGSVEAFAALMEALEVDAYGFNCGLGPDRMLPFVERLAKVSTKPIIVKPNAGMPRLVTETTAEGVISRTVFDVGPDDFAAHILELSAAGASIFGGCCGTTPAHIKAVGLAFQGHEPMEGLASHREPSKPSADTNLSVISSGTSAFQLKPYAGTIIGERINPTGKKLLKEAYAKGDTAYVLREAVKQVEAGAEILDVNCGVPGLDEPSLLESTVKLVESVCTCPLQIDTADPAALERALRVVNGKALVNSVNGKRESMDAVFPLVKKYGGLIVALCLDENGIPPTADGRLQIARKILSEGEKYGFSKKDFIFDALTLSVSVPIEGSVPQKTGSVPTNATVTLETVRRLTEELGVNTILGVSNVSFGLPNRPVLNNTMYALAKQAGISAAIANPAVIKDEIDEAAADVLLGRDPGAEHWIAGSAFGCVGHSASARVPVEKGSVPQEKGSEKGSVPPKMGSVPMEELAAAIKRGLRADAANVAKMALNLQIAPLELINKAIVPALEEIGRLFEQGKVFLPQLLMAADAAGDAFQEVKAKMAADSVGTDPGKMEIVPNLVGTDPDLVGTVPNLVGTDPGKAGTVPVGNRRAIVIATVKGDIHDIGKNIVRALLENYGFEVIDLGRDVPPETIVEAAIKNQAALVGLSALMTTTVGAMAETVRLLKEKVPFVRTVVGGAVVTEEYAAQIGADYYAKDAMRTVRIAEEICSVG